MSLVTRGLLVFALLLSGCGLSKDVIPGEPPPYHLNVNGRAVFGVTLLKAMRTTSKCSNCHTVSGEQMGRPFADSDLNTAYESAKSNDLVDMHSPGTSRVLTYLTNNHCQRIECNVADAATIAIFRKAAEDWANAELEPNPSPSASPTPPNALSSLTGDYTESVQIPQSVPLSPAAPIRFNVPLASLGAAFSGSFLRFDLVYLVSLTDGNGVTTYLYQLSNPVLVNQGASTLSVSVLDVGLEGLYDPQNRIFSSTAFAATAAPGTNVSLNPADPQRAMIFWGHAGTGQNQISANFGTHAP